uniref:Uncharacterized protein n=1 Tax=Romanomermis culicivorax TaxID=13658 RepID=A0A915HLT6_ROMCU
MDGFGMCPLEEQGGPDMVTSVQGLPRISQHGGRRGRGRNTSNVVDDDDGPASCSETSSMSNVNWTGSSLAISISTHLSSSARKVKSEQLLT